MDILRFITAGSIDDGKSTLIGRLLYDTQNIKADILDSISGKGDGGADMNLAFITDGLRAERQEGITIDVAYKYFTTPRRKYIITDAPGHFQYTKNLVTGASGVDVMIILIDAVNGILGQTRRHSLAASFLRIPHIVIAINKMDLVNYDEQVYNNIKNEYGQIARQLALRNVTFIPISALKGDNVTFHSENMPWYAQQTLEQYLENCDPVVPQATSLRLPIQYSRNNNHYGKLISGGIKKGDTITINPGGKKAIVEKIIHNYSEVAEATAGQDICITLGEPAAIKRGDLLSHIADAPQCTNELEAALCWLDETMPLELNKEYILSINAAETSCSITRIISVTDNDTFVQHIGRQQVAVNEFATIKIKTAHPVAFDKFTAIPATGRGILIDKETNNTSGALTIL